MCMIKNYASFFDCSLLLSCVLVGRQHLYLLYQLKALAYASVGVEAEAGDFSYAH